MTVHPLGDEKEWRRVAAACPYATFFHTPEWFAAFTAAEPDWTAEALAFEFPNGASALLPFIRRSNASELPIWMSGPAGVYGGWIADAPLSPGQQRSIIRFITAADHALAWRINPYARLRLSRRMRLRPDHTTVLDLTHGLDPLIATWSESHRRGIARARRCGIQVRRAAATSDWQAYFSCYQASLRRWGERASSRYSWELFAALSRLPEPGVSLWLAEREGRLQAGAVCFSHNRHTVYWHGAAYASGFPDRPVHLLMHEIIRDACMRGERWFDFNPSGGHEGVERFKGGFGGLSLAAPMLDTRIPSSWKRIGTWVRSRLRGRAGAGCP
jgi:hypothetical protein